MPIVARNAGARRPSSPTCKTRGPGVVIGEAADLGDLADPDAFLAGVAAKLGGLDAVLIFHGALGAEAPADAETAAARGILQINFNSPALLALAAARQLESTAKRP